MRLSEKDATLYLIPCHPNNIVTIWQQELNRIYSSSKVESDLLPTLVLSAYHLGEISQGKAIELLGIDYLTFRATYQEFVDNRSLD